MRGHRRLQGGAGQHEEQRGPAQHGATAAHLGAGGAVGQGQPRHQPGRQYGQAGHALQGGR